MNYMDYCVDVSVTIKDAMKCIEIVKPKIVFLVEGKRLKASLTDGDVRRFLLAGGALTDLAIDAGNKNTLYAKTTTGAKELYHQKNFVAIPIVNDERELTDIYIGEKNRMEKQESLNIPVVINAGGKGTRLEPYTKILPKPLIPVGEMPIIEHIMQNFMDYDCEQFSIIVNYKKDLIKAYFADCDKKYDITWYDEDKPLGTGGGLCYLKGKIDTTFFFTNCDNLLLSNYGSMLRFHRENKNVITMVCAYKNIVIPYGVVDMGLNGSINSMEEKPEISFLTNTGIYIVEPEVLSDIEDNVFIGFPDIVKMQMEKGKKVSVYPVSENEWLDMGQLSELDKMREKLYDE
ncbi:MAG: NTP transferase domain-containing protein [Lachnospiraceae bacterium]|nr:NTP transferase domain-containing protein [Lachnospiraceae bacterium]